MKLHTHHGVLAMSHGHDYSVIRSRRDDQFRGEGFLLNDQRMIAADGLRIGETGKYSFSAMPHQARPAMHGLLRPNHFASQRRGYGLMPEADTKDGYFATQLSNDVE